MRCFRGIRELLCSRNDQMRQSQQRRSSEDVMNKDSSPVSSFSSPAYSAASSLRIACVAVVAVSDAKDSIRALKWALDNFASSGDTITLLHVRTPVVSIATAMGYLPLEQASPQVAAAYFQEIKNNTDALLKPFEFLCKKRQVKPEVVVLEDKSIVDAIVAYVTGNRITRLVTGSTSRNFITRLKGPDIPRSIATKIPDSCSLYVISNGKLVSIMDNSDTSSVCSSKSSKTFFGSSSFSSCSCSPKPSKNFRRTRTTSTTSLGTITEQPPGSSSFTESVSDQIQNNLSLGVQPDQRSSNTLSGHFDNSEENYPSTTYSTLDRVSTTNARALRRENLAEESCTQPESMQQTCRRYSIEELELATNFFNESLKIGGGAFGSVYKGTLDHTTVAIKVLNEDEAEGRREFQREVDVLSRIRHPHLLILLGACPERGCLVYEYMNNGSLEDLLFHRDSNTPFPWFVRVRIAFEVASALRFLHTAKPEPIVHCDLKPANILVDRNFVSKIGDVGLSKLIPPNASDSVTEYRNTTLAGTFFYMDPEYQRTGTVTCRSDTYALGIIFLQLLTGTSPMGLTDKVEDALENDSLREILDKTAGDWPLDQAKRLASLALNCSSLRRRDRPDLEAVVLPELERLRPNAQELSPFEEQISPPSQFYCPLLKEIMEDPYIAADGFTYEYRAIKDWLEKHGQPPRSVCRSWMGQTDILPNYTLRLSIMEWKKRYGMID